MKKTILLLLALLCTLSLMACEPIESVFDDVQTEKKTEGKSENATEKYDPVPIPAKPVIYLYPTEETEVSVKLEYDGEFIATYPKYNDGWEVIASPDGTLTSFDGEREYYCLFWEGEGGFEYDLSRGFVVAGKDTEKFLEESLKTLGLTDKEANEFIIYWLPRMENNAYNLISFQGQNYTDAARLEITPTPDSLLRVFMAWQALDQPIEIEPQTLPTFERTGFTVVEWGGSEVK